MQKKTVTNGVVVLGIILMCLFVVSIESLPASAIAYSVSMTTGSFISLDVSPSGDGTSIHEDSINVQSDCRSGYNLSIAAPNGSNLYVDGDNAQFAAFTAVDGTSTLKSSNNTNKWGYSITPNTSNSTVFLPLSVTESVLKTPSQTSSINDINDTFSIYYGIKADNSVSPGTYRMANNGSIVYYLTMSPSCMVVDIAYDGNNSDAGTTMSIVHAGKKDGNVITLAASNFKRSGYGFAGWSFDQNAGTKLMDNDNANNPVVYGPNETVTLPNGLVDSDTDNDGIVKLYAVWLQSQGDLQNWTGCSGLDITAYDSVTSQLDFTKNSVTALTDQRDGNTYAVARLADGNCWMIENLRLDNTASHNSDGWLAQNYNSNFIGLADPEARFEHEAANSLYSVDGANGTIGVNAYFRFPRYNNQNTALPATDMISWDNDSNVYSAGNYYTWAAAVADTAYYPDVYGGGESSITSTSICPAGWRLPVGGTSDNAANNDYWKLGAAMLGVPSDNNYYYSGDTEGVNASKKFRSYPNNIIFSGHIVGSTPIYRGSYAFYWTSTYTSANYYSMFFSIRNKLVSPGTEGGQSNYTKGMGLSVRCIASEPQTYKLTYNANGGSGAPSSQTTTANGIAFFTVRSNTPTRSGYTFVGWMDEKGNETLPNSIFGTKDTNAILYAIWTKNNCNPTATTIGTGDSSTDAVCLQDVNLSMKTGLPIADGANGTYSLIDARDGKSYTVAKLADGNLWLTKNLNYGNSNSVLLTAYDTDLPSGTTFKAPASTTDFETADSISTRISPKILTDNTFGGYYSFAAAIASTKAYSTQYQNATTSICPKGWDLPTGASYNNLRSTTGNTTFAKMGAAPYNFINAGYRNGTSFVNQTSEIRLWTSTVYSPSYAYYTSAYGVASYSSNYKHYGESVRCVASNGTATVHYDANGGSGTMADQTGDINSITINSNSFTVPANSQFRNWNTRADGTGITVVANTPLSSIASNGDAITLYAQWDELYTLTFVNTALASNNTRTKTVVVGQSSTVAPSLSWSRTDYKLVGWDTVTNDGSDTSGTVVYTNGQSITPSSDMTFYTVWRPTYAIAYNINTTDSNAAGTMGNQSNVAEGNNVTLLASNFSRTGYGFAGWSLDPNAASNTSAKIYGPQETISAPSYAFYGNNGIVTMYAVWVRSAGSIQNTSTVSSVCNALTKAPADGTANISSVSALTDQRDNETYAVAKLADGECWMIENLRLESTAAHNSDGSLAQGYGVSSIYGDFGGLANAESNFSDSITENSLYYSGTPTGTASININTLSYPGFRMPRYSNWNNQPISANRPQSPTTNSATNSTTKAGMYSYGNYYTWHAALANTTYYNSSFATDADGKTSETVNTSLCPAGWKLPYGRSTGNGATLGGFSNLDIALGGNGTYSSSSTSPAGSTMSLKWRSYPNNFLYSGYFYKSSVSSRGSIGYYWSSTALSEGYSYNHDISSSEVNPGTGINTKSYGRSIRCVAGS